MVGWLTSLREAGAPTRKAEAEKWLWQHFPNDDRYVPVFWDPDDSWTSPVYQRSPNANLDPGTQQ